MDLRSYKSTDDGRQPLLTQTSESLCTRIASKIWPTGFVSEAKSVIKLAFPVVVTNLSTFLIMTESIIICGHLDDKFKMAGVSLANSIIAALGVCIGTGMCTACDTFFSQLYGSVDQKKRIGMVLQRSLMVVSIVPFIVYAIHLNFEPIFILIGQDLRVSVIASKYIIYFLPGIFFSYHFLVLTRYLQNQDILCPPMVIGVVGNVFNVVTQYVAIYEFGYGVEASAMCQAASFFILWFMLMLYIVFSKIYVDTWDGWSKEAFLDWDNFLGLAIPGIFMVSMESFCWEIGTFLSGLMGPVELGIQSILYQLETLTFMMTFGVSVAVNIRVGQALGANNPERALTAYRAGATVQLISITTIAVIFLILRDYLPMLFSDDPDIIKGTSNIFFVMIGVQIIDSIGTVTMGALRGCGRHKLGTVFIIVAYYVLGQPIGISLAFLTNLKVQGLWIGYLVSLSISVTTVVIVINCQNWDRQAENAQLRIREGLIEQRIESESEAESIYSDGGNTLLYHQKRTPSQGRSRSDSRKLPPARVQVTDEEYARVILFRFVIVLVVMIVFAGGIILKVNLPRSVYWPKGVNVTVNP